MQFSHLPESPGIYIIKNKETGKVYVGSSMNPRKRLSFHLYSLKKGVHHSIKLQNSWNKHGEENFECDTVESIECEGKETINIFARERFWVDHYDSIANGYNINNPGVDSARKVSSKSVENTDLIIEDDYIVDDRRCEIRGRVTAETKRKFLRIISCYGVGMNEGLQMAVAALWRQEKDIVKTHEEEKAREFGVTEKEIQVKEFGHYKQRGRKKRLNLEETNEQ